MFLPSSIVFVLAFIFYIGAITIHLFIIKKTIPFNYVNGGRSDSYEHQLKQSKMSILILAIGLLYVILGLLVPTLRKTIVFMVISFMLTFLWFVGTVMQLIGTKFERYYVSWLNLFGTVAHLELALTYFSQDE